MQSISRLARRPPAARNDTIRVERPAAAGLGNPFKRPVIKSWKMFGQGYVSIERARFQTALPCIWPAAS